MTNSYTQVVAGRSKKKREVQRSHAKLLLQVEVVHLEKEVQQQAK